MMLVNNEQQHSLYLALPMPAEMHLFSELRLQHLFVMLIRVVHAKPSSTVVKRLVGYYTLDVHIVYLISTQTAPQLTCFCCRPCCACSCCHCALRAAAGFRVVALRRGPLVVSVATLR